MKNFKRIAAMAAAMTLAACTAAPIISFAEAAENTISFTGATIGSHSYTAYRIFNGTAVENGMNASDGAILSDAVWAGKTGGNSNFNTFISALKTEDTFKFGDTSNVFATVNTEAELISVLSGFGTNSVKAKAFAKYVVENASTYNLPTTDTDTNGTIAADTDGYYVIKETTSAGVVKSSYLLGVYDASAGAEVTVKSCAPTVDKTVSDEGRNPVWGETADHAINETFQFKLEASLTDDPNYADYNTYRLVFTDELNTGVKYDGNISVKVKSGTSEVTVPEYNETSAPSGYKFTPIAGSTAATTIGDTGYTGGGKFNLTIGDIKQYLPDGVTLGTDDITVEVIYDAHLNENATVADSTNGNVPTTYNNVNKVKLSYSSNPNVTGSGNSNDIPSTGTPGKPGTPGTDDNPTTPGNNEELSNTTDDYVWVFTYGANGIKVDGATKNNGSGDYSTKLGGAEFRLYSDSDCTSEINLGLDTTDGKYYPLLSGNAVIKSSEEAGTLGTFAIKGLDAGTYYLKETKAPDGGYNTLKDARSIVISATHLENEDKTSATVTLGSNNTNKNFYVENNKGSSLPSTGGMGTYMFYGIGGAIAVGTGVILVSKKRAKDEE